MTNSTVADQAAERAHQQLTAQHPKLVATVFHYGAVDIDPKHLVVWVLLDGPPDHIPVWYFPHRDHPLEYAADLLAEIDAMRATVVDCFVAQEWPDAEQIHVGFDSFDRVAANGGWHYFK
jgi:hypothetical protein